MEGTQRAPLRYEWIILSLTVTVMILFFVGGTFAANLQERYALSGRKAGDFNRSMDPQVGDRVQVPFKLAYARNKLFFLGGCASCTVNSLNLSIFRGDPSAILLFETTNESDLRSYRKLYPDLRFEPYGDDLKRSFNAFYAPRAYVVSQDRKILYVQSQNVPTRKYEEFLRELR